LIAPQALFHSGAANSLLKNNPSTVSYSIKITLVIVFIFSLTRKHFSMQMYTDKILCTVVSTINMVAYAALTHKKENIHAIF